MSADSPTGSVVGGFRIGELLARGAMGAVYLAEDRDGRRVALKLLSPELAHDERFRQRFLRESRLAATLDHPNVVRTIASGEDGGVLYLVMEYVNGIDLRELLRREGRLEPRRAVELVRQAGEALDTAHRAGLVHRDVKPGNILVEHTPEGERAYVCDFGLARHVSSVGSLTGDRGFVGTVDYVAPEQIRGGSVDGRADLYALGCVLFECIAGERPYERDSELAVVFAHLNEPPPRLTDVRPELPTALDHVIGTAMAKSPRDRYRTAGELYRAADAAIEGAPAPPRARRRSGLLVGGRRSPRRTRSCGRARRRARDEGRLGSDAAADHAGVDRRCHPRADERRLQGAVRRRLARRDLPGAELPDTPLLRPQGRHLLRVSHRSCGRDHDVEQGLQDGGRNRPLLVDRGSEERLRQRAPPVAS